MSSEDGEPDEHCIKVGRGTHRESGVIASEGEEGRSTVV